MSTREKGKVQTKNRGKKRNHYSDSEDSDCSSSSYSASHSHSTRSYSSSNSHSPSYSQYSSRSSYSHSDTDSDCDTYSDIESRSPIPTTAVKSTHAIITKVIPTPIVKTTPNNKTLAHGRPPAIITCHTPVVVTKNNNNIPQVNTPKQIIQKDDTSKSSSVKKTVRKESIPKQNNYTSKPTMAKPHLCQ